MRSRRFIWILALAAVLVAGCCIEPPLHLRRVVTTKVTTKVDVDLRWQFNWTTQWDFNWNVTALGPLGYRLPSSIRLHVYTQGPEGEHISHMVHNFVGSETQMDVFVGTHDLLFHNNDSEAILFQSDGDLEPIHAYTRQISKGLRESSPVYTTAQKAAGLNTKADDEEEIEEPVSLQPDDLFSFYDINQKITDNPNDYVFENGRYVLKIEGELLPSTFIYLVQVKLVNNDDRIIGSGGGAITGMSEGVNLVTRETWTSTVSVPTDVYMDKEQDLLGAKVYSFGLPGCNPYDEASVAAAPAGEHYYVLNVNYVNGSWRNIRMDITDQITALPLGGVITLEIDVNDFPPDESSGTGGGGFQALIDGWEEEVGSTTIDY
jgi:hypothetical protein